MLLTTMTVASTTTKIHLESKLRVIKFITLTGFLLLDLRVIKFITLNTLVGFLLLDLRVIKFITLTGFLSEVKTGTVKTANPVCSRGTGSVFRTGSKNILIY